MKYLNALNKINGISKHAILRFMERAGSTKVSRAREQILALAKAAKRVPGMDNWQSSGWEIVINRHGWVETIYRRGRMENKAVLKKRKFDYA